MLAAIKRVVGGLVPSGLGGAFFLLCFAKVQDPSSNAVGLLVMGGLCGVVVVGLIRLFRIAPWGYPVAGLLCGPLPLFVLMRGQGDFGQEEDRFGIWLLAAIFGALIGTLEWARVRRMGAGPGD